MHHVCTSLSVGPDMRLRSFALSFGPNRLQARQSCHGTYGGARSLGGSLLCPLLDLFPCTGQASPTVAVALLLPARPLSLNYISISVQTLRLFKAYLPSSVEENTRCFWQFYVPRWGFVDRRCWFIPGRVCSRYLSPGRSRCEVGPAARSYRCCLLHARCVCGATRYRS